MEWQQSGRKHVGKVVPHPIGYKAHIFDGAGPVQVRKFWLLRSAQAWVRDELARLDRLDRIAVSTEEPEPLRCPECGAVVEVREAWGDGPDAIPTHILSCCGLYVASYNPVQVVAAWRRISDV